MMTRDGCYIDQGLKGNSCTRRFARRISRVYNMRTSGDKERKRGVCELGEPIDLQLIDFPTLVLYIDGIDTHKRLERERDTPQTIGDRGNRTPWIDRKHAGPIQISRFLVLSLSPFQFRQYHRIGSWRKSSPVIDLAVRPVEKRRRLVRKNENGSAAETNFLWGGINHTANIS